MTSVVAKWGNSLAIRLPQKLAAAAHIAAGTKLHISTAAGRLILEPASPTLEQLVADITPQNRHAEVPTGQVSGQEIW